MSSSTKKLTKKQKKGLAFREGKGGRRQGKDDHYDLENNAFPDLESEGFATFLADELQKESNEAQSLETENGKDKVGNTKATKRKRTDEVDAKSLNKIKKRKTESNEKHSEGKEKPTKQRFILFVGNLKYTTDLKAIQEHFSSCDPPPTVRLLTPKSKSEIQKSKSKGCAFLEFTHRNALQQGLKFHQTSLDGRMINVELTVGGGGKSEPRLAKVRERNKALLVQREGHSVKETSNDDSLQSQSLKPQRFSSTSGMEQTSVSKRTWTVGDSDGERHKRPKKQKLKTWGTGVNAIPVG